jgi:TP901 family phage tail tape measure protein
MAAEVRSLILAIDARKAKQGAAQFEGATGRVTAGSKRADASLKRLGNTAGDVGVRLKALVGAFVAFQVLRAGARQIVAFEDALIGVGKTADIAGAALVGMGRDISELSRRLPSTSLRLLEIAKAAGQLGVTGKGNILAFSETVARLGAATDLSGEEAATTLARLLNVTGEAVGTVGTLGSVITRLGNEFAASEAEIAIVAQRVAQAGTAFGITSTEAVGFAAAMRSFGIEAELAGGTVGRTLVELEKFVVKGGRDLESLDDSLGLVRGGFAAAFGDSPVAALKLFIKQLADLRNQGVSTTETLTKLGITNSRDVRVIATLASNYHLLEEALATANDEARNTNALLEESERGARSLGSRLTILSNTFLSVFDSVAESNGSLSSFVDSIADAVNILAGFERNAETASETGAVLARAINAAGAALLAFVGIKAVAFLVGVAKGVLDQAKAFAVLIPAQKTSTALVVENVAATQAQIAAEAHAATALGIGTVQKAARTAAATAQAAAELKVAAVLGIQTVAVRAATIAWRSMLAPFVSVASTIAILAAAFIGLSQDIVSATDPLNKYASALDRLKNIALQAADAQVSLSRAIEVGDLSRQRSALAQQIEAAVQFSEEVRKLEKGTQLPTKQISEQFPDLTRRDIVGRDLDRLGIREELERLNKPLGIDTLGGIFDVGAETAIQIAEDQIKSLNKDLAEVDEALSKTREILPLGDLTGSGGGGDDPKRVADQRTALEKLIATMGDEVRLLSERGDARELLAARMAAEAAALRDLQAGKRETAVLDQAEIELVDFLTRAALDLGKTEEAEAAAVDKRNEARERLLQTMEQELAAAAQQRRQVERVTEDLEFNTRILGLNNAEREKAIALRQAGLGDPSTPQEVGQASRIREDVDALLEAEKLRGITDGVAVGFANMFESFLTGAASAKEALANLGVELSTLLLRRIVLDPFVDLLSTALFGLFDQQVVSATTAAGIEAGSASTSAGIKIGAATTAAAIEIAAATTAATIRAGSAAIGALAGGLSGAAAGVAAGGGSGVGALAGVLPFARGGVLDKPTLFPLGLAGEAGPEGILPLKRGPGGRLGVTGVGEGPDVLPLRRDAAGILGVDTGQLAQNRVSQEIAQAIFDSAFSVRERQRPSDLPVATQRGGFMSRISSDSTATLFQPFLQSVQPTAQIPSAIIDRATPFAKGGILGTGGFLSSSGGVSPLNLPTSGLIPSTRGRGGQVAVGVADGGDGTISDRTIVTNNSFTMNVKSNDKDSFRRNKRQLGDLVKDFQR